MTPILAKVLAVENQADQYKVIVRIGLAKYRGSFNTLTFGENKPSIGFCHEGRLELVYYKDPGLKAGQQFPLWTIHEPQQRFRLRIHSHKRMFLLHPFEFRFQAKDGP